MAKKKQPTSTVPIRKRWENMIENAGTADFYCHAELGRESIAEIDRLTLALSAASERAEKYERVLASACDHLMEYAEWFGAMHIEGCPEDDTCNCVHRPVNESVSCLCVIAATAKGNRDFAARAINDQSEPQPPQTQTQNTTTPE